MTMGGSNNTHNFNNTLDSDIKSQIKKLQPLQVIELKKAILEVDAEKEVQGRYSVQTSKKSGLPLIKMRNTMENK